MSSPSAEPPEPGEVLGELGRAAGSGAQRLEDAIAQLEAAIERGQVRLVGGHELAVDPDVAPGEAGTGSLTPPRARRSR